jgi:dTDP-4-dehydrorhamnose 3,5-epimerase
LKVFKPRVFRDPRGWFLESYSQRDLAAAGLNETFVQDNLAFSTRGALRGLHFQAGASAQAKLVTVLIGTAWDVAVDLRVGSPTYGQWFGLELTAEDPTLFYVPVGFAHGYAVLSDTCLFAYKCSNYYDKAAEGGLLWSSPELAIDWKLADPILSDKDRLYPTLTDLVSPFVFSPEAHLV